MNSESSYFDDELSEEELDSLFATEAGMTLAEWKKKKAQWERFYFRTKKELNTFLQECGHTELIGKK